MGTESSRIQLLRALFSGRHAQLELGIGDDAAILAGTEQSTVWTIDAAVENVHFRRDFLSMRQIGYRATTAALSDLAAMGASPVAILSSLILPSEISDDALRELAMGQKEAADAVSAVVAGGNLARGSELSITTAAMGVTPKALRRDGARAGDFLYVCGPVGFSYLGLCALLSGMPEPSNAMIARAIEAFRRPVAHVAEGLLARDLATAAIDISDGLSTDAGHLAKASGLLVVLDEKAIVSAELEQTAALLQKDALWAALSGGEDYSLLVTAPEAASQKMPAGFRRIGHCEALPEGALEGGVMLLKHSGQRILVEASGFDHFRGRNSQGPGP